MDATTVDPNVVWLYAIALVVVLLGIVGVLMVRAVVRYMTHRKF